MIAHSIDEGLKMAVTSGESEVFVIGGGEIFSQTIASANRLYLTLIHSRVIADVYFPVIDDSQWRQIESATYPAGEKDQYPHTYRVLERLSRS